MSKQEKLIKFYQHTLTMLNVTIEQDDALTGSSGQPIIIDGKRVYLPTNTTLRAMTPDMVGFHPLCENVFEGMSDIMVLLRKLAMCRISDIVLMSVYSLVKLAVDKASQASLSASQLEVISKLADADEKLVESIEKLSEQIDVDTPNRIINLALRHSPLVENEGVKNGRSCHVTSPLWDELVRSSDGVVFGVKFRKKDLATLKEALKLVLPHVDEIEKYSTDSTSPVAPYFITFLKTVMTILADTNKVAWKFRSYIAEANHGQHLHVAISDAEFLDAIENIKDIATAVKPLPYNMGNKAVEDVSRSSTRAEEVVERLSRAEDRMSEERGNTRSSGRSDNWGRSRREDDRYYRDEPRCRSSRYDDERTERRSTPIGVRSDDSYNYGRRRGSRYDDDRYYRDEPRRSRGSRYGDDRGRSDWRSTSRR